MPQLDIQDRSEGNLRGEGSEDITYLTTIQIQQGKVNEGISIYLDSVVPTAL